MYLKKKKNDVLGIGIENCKLMYVFEVWILMLI